MGKEILSVQWLYRTAVAVAVACVGSVQATQDASPWEALEAAAGTGAGDLSLEVVADRENPEVLQVGEPLSYRLRAEDKGYCYLLHVDSRFRATLISPATCDGGEAAGPLDVLFPESGGLKADYPEGSDVVYGIVAPQPLATLDALVGARGAVASLTVDKAQALAAELVSAAHNGELAVASVSYEVAEEAPSTKFTTRGIIRKVVASKQTTGEARDLATFSISDIHFDFGSDHLTQESQRELDVFGAALKSRELDDVRLRVAGHTDDVGDREYNYALSMRRAIAVKEYLVGRFALDASRLDTVGYGEDRPVVTGEDNEARALNRRVEMVFMKGESNP